MVGLADSEPPMPHVICVVYKSANPEAGRIKFLLSHQKLNMPSW